MRIAATSIGSPTAESNLRLSAQESRGPGSMRGNSPDSATLSAAISRQLASGRWAIRIQQLEQQVRAEGYRPDPGRLAEKILTAAEIDARISTMMIEN